MAKTILERERDSLLDSYALEISQLCYRISDCERCSCENEKESKALYRSLADRLDAIPGDEGKTLKKILAGFKG